MAWVYIGSGSIHLRRTLLPLTFRVRASTTLAFPLRMRSSPPALPGFARLSLGFWADRGAAASIRMKNSVRAFVGLQLRAEGMDERWRGRTLSEVSGVVSVILRLRSVP